MTADFKANTIASYSDVDADRINLLQFHNKTEASLRAYAEFNVSPLRRGSEIREIHVVRPPQYSFEFFRKPEEKNDRRSEYLLSRAEMQKDFLREGE
ncbi:hypothetical protein ACTPOE_14780 [Castellaniella sp. WN]